MPEGESCLCSTASCWLPAISQGKGTWQGSLGEVLRADKWQHHQTLAPWISTVLWPAKLTSHPWLLRNGQQFVYVNSTEVKQNKTKQNLLKTNNKNPLTQITFPGYCWQECWVQVSSESKYSICSSEPAGPSRGTFSELGHSYRGCSCQQLEQGLWGTGLQYNCYHLPPQSKAAIVNTLWTL